MSDLRYTGDELEGARIEGLHEAAEALCAYCRREGPPRHNEQGVAVHRTFSSRGLGSDHACSAQAIHDVIAKSQKKENASNE